MINLLPYGYKNQVLYGRKNMVLTRWILAMLVAMLVIFTVAGAGTVYMYKTTSDQRKSVNQAKQQLAAKNLEQNYQTFSKLAGDFNTVVSIASQQVRYSNIMKSIAPLLPESTTLNGIELTQGVSAVEIKLNGQNQSVLTQALVNISDKKNNVFASADFNNITCKDTTASGGASDEPPCRASIKGLLAKNKDFYFISPEEAKK
jgi:uncharacterized membrane protein